MGILGLLALWLIWLTIAALLLRFTVGGVIDCLKRGSRAPVTSWIGAVIFTIIILIIVAVNN